MHFDQSSRLAIRLKIFLFATINSKFDESFSLVGRACACREKYIDVQHQRFRIKTKSSYSFEDRGTDRRNQFQNVLAKTFRMVFYYTSTKAEN